MSGPIKLAKLILNMEFADMGIKIHFIYSIDFYRNNKDKCFVYTNNDWCIMRGQYFTINLKSKMILIPKDGKLDFVYVEFLSEQERYNFLKLFRNLLLEWSSASFFNNEKIFEKTPKIEYDDITWSIY